MSTRARRVIGRSCLVGAAAALALAFAPWTAFAQTSDGSSGSGGSTSSSDSSSSRPRVFTSTATVTAVEFFPDRNNGFTIPDAARVRFVAGDSGTSQSGGPEARASMADPGGGGTKGPAQVCGLAGGPVSQNMPQLSFVFDACRNTHWPFTVEADEFQNDIATAGSTEVGQPAGMIYGQGGSAHARIDSDNFSSSTEAVLGGLRLNPLPGANSTGLPLPPALPLPGGGGGTAPAAPVDPTIFNIESITGATTNTFEGQTLVSHSESHLQGVHLLGGLVTIDSIATVAESRSADGAAPVGTSSVNVQGVTVMGQRAGIGSDGITFGDSGAGDPNAVAGPLNQALQNLGVTVKLIGAAQTQDPSGLMNATASGVEVDFAHPVDFSGTPLAALGLTDVYTAKLVLGSSSAGDLARNISRPTRLPGSTLGGSSAGNSASGVSSGTKVGSPQVTPQPSAGGAAAGDQGTGNEENGQRASVLGIDPGRIKFLYLSFTLVALALCISPRLTLPHRLPGAGQ